MALIDKLTNIADAIRGKTGKNEALTLDQMSLEIAGIVAGGGQYETGEIIGDGTSLLRIPVSFEPDFLYVCLTDTTTTLDATHIFGAALVRDLMHQASYRGAGAITPSNGGFGYHIDGLYGTNTNRANYANGILSWTLAPASRTFANGTSYTWIARRW